MGDRASAVAGVDRVVQLLLRKAKHSARRSIDDSESPAGADSEEARFPASKSASEIIADLGETLSGSNSGKYGHGDTESERRGAEALLHLASLSTDLTMFEGGCDAVKDLQTTIQQGIEGVVTSLEQVALRVRAPEDLSVVLFFFEELSQLPHFCPGVELVVHSISKEVLQWLGPTSSPAEHEPIRLQFLLEFLVKCSSYKWMNFQQVMTTEDLYKLYIELSRHGLQKTAAILLFNLSTNEIYDDVTSLETRAILSCALKPEDTQVSSNFDIGALREPSPRPAALDVPPTPLLTPGRTPDHRSSDRGDSCQHHSGYSINMIRADSTSKVSNQAGEEETAELQLEYTLATAYQRLLETLSTARLERHRGILLIRLRNTNVFILVTSLFIVAQVVYSSLLLSRKVPIQPGQEAHVEATWTAAVVLAFASVFLGFANAVSAFSFTQAISRALETIQQILDIQMQAHDWLVSVRKPKAPGGQPIIEHQRHRPQGTGFVQRFCEGVEQGGDDARRLDHVVREHIHDGSKFGVLLACDVALFMASVVLSAISTKSMPIWLPPFIFFFGYLTYICFRELKNRPGVLRMLLKHLPWHRHLRLQRQRNPSHIDIVPHYEARNAYSI